MSNEAQISALWEKERAACHSERLIQDHVYRPSVAYNRAHAPLVASQNRGGLESIIGPGLPGARDTAL